MLYSIIKENKWIIPVGLGVLGVGGFFVARKLGKFKKGVEATAKELGGVVSTGIQSAENLLMGGLQTTQNVMSNLSAQHNERVQTRQDARTQRQENRQEFVQDIGQKLGSTVSSVGATVKGGAQQISNFFGGLF